MRFKILTYFFSILSITSFAQADEYGLYSDLIINSLAPAPTKIRGVRQAISRSLVYKNNNTTLGYYARYDKYIFGVNLDVSVFADDFMIEKGIEISDTYYNKEQFVIADLYPDKTISHNDIGLMFLLGFEILDNNDYKIYFSNRLGFKNVSNRNSDLVLKESGTNNYYVAHYKTITNPIYTYKPSIELEVFPFEKPISFYVHTGVNFQYYQVLSTVDLYDTNNLTLLKDQEINKYINLSTTIMTGFGLRMAIW